MDDYGHVNRIVARASQEVGIDVEFQFLPWKRALEEARRGHYAASSYWYHSEDREQDFIHVGPISEERIVFFHRRDHDVPSWSSLDDLSGFKIGATNGYTYSKAFWDAAEGGKLTVEVAADDVTNLRKLLAGRIDLFAAESSLGWYLINENFTKSEQAQLATLNRPLRITSGYLLVSRKALDAEAVAASLQRGIDSIRDQGLIDQFVRDLMPGDH
ncbi:MAG: substrate-binding periplasmic protein [Geminicoccaceae bacterium]